MTADQGLLRKKTRLFYQIIYVSILPLDDMISEQGEERELADHVIKAHWLLLNRIPILSHKDCDLCYTVDSIN